MMVCNFHWDTGVSVITIVCLAIILGSMAFVWTVRFQYGFVRYLIIIGLCLPIIVGLLIMPLKLKLKDDRVEVTRMIGVIDIPLSGIEQCGVVGHEVLNNSVRVFGSGGVFGYLGIFKNNMLGKYTMYATEIDRLIFIKTSQKTYVFSCVDPTGFIDKIRMLK